MTQNTKISRGEVIVFTYVPWSRVPTHEWYPPSEEGWLVAHEYMLPHKSDQPVRILTDEMIDVAVEAFYASYGGDYVPYLKVHMRAALLAVLPAIVDACAEVAYGQHDAGTAAYEISQLVEPG